jgi:hypothetical protein
MITSIFVIRDQSSSGVLDHHQPAVQTAGRRKYRGQAGAQADSPDQRATKMLATDRAQGLERSLDYALRANVFPGAGRILGKHGQILIL